MKKNFKFYLIMWIILFAIFNLVAFPLRQVNLDYGISDGGNFWAAWAFVCIAFIVNLACAFYAFKDENLRKTAYNISLVSISWTALGVIVFLSSMFMLIPDVPVAVVIIVNLLVLAINAISIVKGIWAVDIVSGIDDKVKSKTSFIKNLSLDASSLVNLAKDDYAKAECKRVYDAIRYSDPMSNDGLSLVEAQITVKMNEFSQSLNLEDPDLIREKASELVNLIADRNARCKAYK